MFGSVVATGDDRVKELCSDSLITVVREYVACSPFDSKLDGLRYFTQLFAPDSLVKLLAWNISFSDGTNRYSCFIARKGEKGTDLWLVDSRKGLPGTANDKTLGLTDWYGALYYDIRVFSSGGSTKYLLLGLDLNGIYTHSKVIDFLNFDDESEPCFGAPLIMTGKQAAYRMVFTYSSMVSMMLRYDNDNNRILFDHLSPSEPRFAGVYQYYGPDSSYDALDLRDGLWFISEDIDLRYDY